MIFHSYHIIYSFISLNTPNIDFEHKDIPLLDVDRSDGLRIPFPGTPNVTAWKTSKIKLAADGRFWTTSVRNIIGVKWHQMGEHICI